MPNFPEGDNWPKRLGNQLKSLLKTRQGHLKNRTSSPNDLISWEGESVPSLPSKAGSKPPKEKTTTIFDYEVKKAKSMQW